MSVKYSAPGKLFISGEWAILEVGNFGLVAAVNNRVHVSIDDHDHGISVTAEEFGVRNVHAMYENGKIIIDADEKTQATLKLLGESMAVSLRFLSDHGLHAKPFAVSTRSRDTQFEVNGQLKKVGFGFRGPQMRR